MKRINKILLIVFCTVVAISFFGCNKDADKTKNIPIIKITNADVELAYKNATKLCERLLVNQLECDRKDSIQDASQFANYVWYRVTEGNLKSLRDLEIYLRVFFSKEIAVNLINKTQIGDYKEKMIERDDKLYTQYGSGKGWRGSHLDETYTYTKVNDYKIIMHVKVKLNTDYNPNGPAYENFDFVYENLDGKRWVFTSFPFYS